MVIVVSYAAILSQLACTRSVTEGIDLDDAKKDAQSFASALERDDLAQMYEHMGTWYRTGVTMEDFVGFVEALYEACGQPSSLAFKDVRIGGILSGGGLPEDRPVAKAYFQMLGPRVHHDDCLLKVYVVPDEKGPQVAFFWYDTITNLDQQEKAREAE